MADTKTVDLGSVGIVNGHTYSETTTYNSNTFVKYKESTWLCIKDGTVGIEPNYANTSNWQAMAIGIDQYTTESQKAAKEAKSYAIGDTSTRDGEDTDNAKYYSEQAKASEEKAATSETNAKTSETNAKDSEDNSSASEVNADMYKKDAAASAANAKASENAAKASETKAKDSETAAKSSETNAKASEISAIDAANRANKIANGLTGALKPMGTITHDKLPALSDAIAGDMYNISDGYTSDDNYEDGSGVFIPAGSNVYKTANGKWDVLAGTSINGVKGAAETEYHTNGNIDLGPSAIGSPSVKDMNNAVAKLNGLIDAKLNKDNVSNAKNVTASGYAADARAIKEIWDTINIILSVPDGAEYHNRIRPFDKRKCLATVSAGNDIPTTILNNIRNRTYHDIFLGDYIVDTTNNKTYNVAAIDYFIHCGYRPDVADIGGHLVMMPTNDWLSGNGKDTTYAMNDTATTSGGVINSKGMKTTIPLIDNALSKVFTSSLLSHLEYLSNGIDSEGYANSGEWVIVKSCIPCESMMYGGIVSAANKLNGSGMFNTGICKNILPLLLFMAEFLNTRQTYWLRDIVNAKDYAGCDWAGGARYYDATDPWSGFRPYFLLG